MSSSFSRHHGASITSLLPSYPGASWAAGRNFHCPQSLHLPPGQERRRTSPTAPSSFVKLPPHPATSPHCTSSHLDSTFCASRRAHSRTPPPFAPTKPSLVHQALPDLPFRGSCGARTTCLITGRRFATLPRLGVYYGLPFKVPLATSLAGAFAIPGAQTGTPRTCGPMRQQRLPSVLVITMEDDTYTSLRAWGRRLRSGNLHRTRRLARGRHGYAWGGAATPGGGALYRHC